MATRIEIDKLAEALAEARAALAVDVQWLVAQIEEVKNSKIPTIRKRVASAKDAHAALAAAIEASPELFDKPRTMTLHGIKCGFQKSKGSVVFADSEEKIIARIRELLPRDQVELLIRVAESVHKPSVYDLTAADLKRLGIQIRGAGDEVVIKDATAEVDKWVATLLKDNPEGEA